MTLIEKLRNLSIWVYVRKDEAYALLEYCAGAAIICGILWVALNGLGTNLSTLLQRIGQWATRRTTAISAN